MGLNQTLITGDLFSVRPIWHTKAFSNPAIASLQLSFLIKLSQVVKWGACELVY